jgi:hypothetical protein
MWFSIFQEAERQGVLNEILRVTERDFPGSRIARNGRPEIKVEARAPPARELTVSRPRAGSRRCVVKAHYTALAAGGRNVALLHPAYIERDGVERDGIRGTPLWR